MAHVAQTQKHWRDLAIERSEAITDAWEVTKVVTGRLAEWILFFCMIANIVGILPGVSLPLLITNTVMGVQIVTLDIAGFGLATMAQHARETGAEKDAQNAQWTAYLLIGIMMLTLIIFTLGLMVPSIREYTDIAEKVLILVRVALIVLYGHVIHSLRRITEHQIDTLRIQIVEEKQAEIERLHATHKSELAETITRLEVQHKEQVQALQVVATSDVKQEEKKPFVNCEQVLFEDEQLTEDVNFSNDFLFTEYASVPPQQKQEEITETVNNEQLTEDVEECKQETETEPLPVVNKTTKKVTAKTSSKRGDAYKRVERLLTAAPNAQPSEIAKRAKVSRAYVSRIRKETVKTS